MLKSGRVDKGMKIPVRIPKIGTAQQAPFDIKEAVFKNCVKCGHSFFDDCLKLGIVSAMAPSNTTKTDQLIKFEVYKCRSCGHVYGDAVAEKEPKGL